LPPQTAEKLYFAHPLTAAEQEMVRELPDIVVRLLGNIPRLEPVLDLLSCLNPDPKRPRKDALKNIASQILLVATEFDLLESRGMPVQTAIAALRSQVKLFDFHVLDALSKCKDASVHQEVRELPIHSVAAGMIFAEDIRTSQGMLLAARGYEITEGFVARAREFVPGHVLEPVRVIVRSQVKAGELGEEKIIAG